eukprot:6933757-Prorocentrum_lima.AAC.1
MTQDRGPAAGSRSWSLPPAPFRHSGCSSLGMRYKLPSPGLDRQRRTLSLRFISHPTTGLRPSAPSEKHSPDLPPSG